MHKRKKTLEMNKMCLKKIINKKTAIGTCSNVCVFEFVVRETRYELLKRATNNKTIIHTHYQVYNSFGVLQVHYFRFLTMRLAGRVQGTAT